jgi:hypothetical protein
MTTFHNRIQRTTVVSMGSILFFILLYTLFLLNHIYGNALSNSFLAPEVFTAGCPSPQLAENLSDPDLHSETGTNISSPDFPGVPEATPKPKISNDQTASSESDLGHWTFTPIRDQRVYTLSPEQCNAAFPGLFTEIDRAVEYRKKVGMVTPADVDISWKDDGAVRAVILDQQVRAIFLLLILVANSILNF